MSEDPIGFTAGDANLSRYVGNSSVMYIDPRGLKETMPMEDVIHNINSANHLSKKQKSWLEGQVARGCVGLTTASIGQSVGGYPSFDRVYDNPQVAASELKRIRASGKDGYVFSVHFWGPKGQSGLQHNKDGSVNMSNSFDPKRHRPPWMDTNGDGRVDSADSRGVNFDFAIWRKTPFGDRWVHADQYHNPDCDGDGKGDYYPDPKVPIRSATVYFSTMNEWRQSYPDFNVEVWGVVIVEPKKYESK